MQETRLKDSATFAECPSRASSVSRRLVQIRR
jgi:hypothetical protein